MSVQVGDKVRYVPEECHAFDVMPDGSLAWDFASTRGRDGDEPLPREEVARAMKNRRQGGTQIRPLAPRCCWPAVVRAVKEGNVLDLDIEGRPQGCCFHYDNVPFAQKKDNTPHTWHYEESH